MLDRGCDPILSRYRSPMCPQPTTAIRTDSTLGAQRPLSRNGAGGTQQSESLGQRTEKLLPTQMFELLGQRTEGKKKKTKTFAHLSGRGIHPTWARLKAARGGRGYPVSVLGCPVRKSLRYLLLLLF